MHDDAVSEISACFRYIPMHKLIFDLVHESEYHGQGSQKYPSVWQLTLQHCATNVPQEHGPHEAFKVCLVPKPFLDAYFDCFPIASKDLLSDRVFVSITTTEALCLVKRESCETIL